MNRALSFLALVASTVAAACAGSPVAQPSPVASAGIATVAPSSPVGAATASPSSAGPSASVPPASAGASAATKHLTYVALGDSLLYALETDCNACTSAAVTYGARASSDLGIPVEVHNLTMHNGLTSAVLLDYLRRGASIGRAGEDLRKAVAAADIVSVTIGFNDSTMPDAKRLEAFSKEYRRTLDAILTEIDELRAGKPTAVRVTEIYNNGIGSTPDVDPDGPGTGVAVWKPITEAQNQVVCAVAKGHRAVCVDIYHAFNGPDGLSSPAAAGYLGPDQVHPSQRGQDVIAAAMVKVGYAPLSGG
jgi:lysophospholipase L1-like esterase